MKWQPMPARALLPSGTRVLVLCGQPAQKYGTRFTLSLALEAEKQLDKALEVQKRAVELDAKEPMLRWRLAKLLVQQGEKGEARKHLELLAAMGTRFGLQNQVAALMRTL